ncbi:tRNA pseudouridine(38/39) synthase [Leucoagaricus sp. SymC.cos]|nr:tRNA pseudouridine(38/39) synthase [Leucoagaricus sp. SymC.cos]
MTYYHNYRYLFGRLPTARFRRIMTTNPRREDYKGWTREQLIERLVKLEGERSVNAPVPTPPPSTSTLPTTTKATQDALSSSTKPQPLTTSHPPKSSTKEFNFSNHPKRKIALKFCYSGWEYGGLAFQNITGDLPTVEGVLFDALAKARLIDPSGGMEGCEWEKCGRTDKGVSAAGQVVSLWVRSAAGSGEEVQRVESKQGVERVKEVQVREEEEEEGIQEDSGLPGLREEDFGTLDLSRPSSPALTSSKRTSENSKPRNELDYIAILNRILPPTIRILAWAPVSPSFSARFSCKYRHYKYFFSSHSLNIPAMREAAAKLAGEHDFRNLCKVDAQKQITMFKRIIVRADIKPVDANIAGSGGERGEDMFVFNLIGSAFLYHQVRHIMAILFLIGTGLEKPSLVTQLMHVTQGAEDHFASGQELEILDRKPEYQMADALPLVLWDCGYAEEDVKWRAGTLEPSPGAPSSSLGDEDMRRSGTGADTDLYHQLHSIWNRSRVYTVLDRHFLQAAERYHRPPQSVLPLPSSTTTSEALQSFGAPVNYPLGGGTYKRAVKYVPVMKRDRLDTVEVINERWRLGKGSRRAERKGDNGNGNGVNDGDE